MQSREFVLPDLLGFKSKFIIYGLLLGLGCAALGEGNPHVGLKICESRVTAMTRSPASFTLCPQAGAGASWVPMPPAGTESGDGSSAAGAATGPP